MEFGCDQQWEEVGGRRWRGGEGERGVEMSVDYWFCCGG